MKKIVIVLTAVFLLLLAFVSCAPSAKTTEMGTATPTTPTTPSVPRPTPSPTPSPTVPMPPPVVITDGGTGYSSDVERMIVRTAQMSMVVEDITTTIDRITQLAESYKGYVVSSNSWRDGERLHGTISIRIPAGDFGNVMAALASLAVEVTSQSTSSQDVTEEYVDLTAKLNNLEATEQQLLRIMEKAETVEDILKVQSQLSSTRAQIEQTKARMQYLEKTSSASLIQVNLEQSKLDAKFTADKRFVRAGENVRFIPEVAGGFTPYSYQWDFGDGKTSNDAAPAHVYRGAGTYTVLLKVTDDRGNIADATMSDYITVRPGWNAGSVAGSAWNGFVGFLHVMVNIIIWLGIFSPVWIIAGGIVYWRLRRRKKA
ncbi:MAG: DUF4349 domain-containing protein [Chloroflexota bacterium]